jgi:N-acyl homoserine lactone hydrolase
MTSRGDHTRTTFKAGLAIAFLVLSCGSLRAASPEIKLYALDCGTLEMGDMGGYSDTGDYDGQAGHVADTCFLIVHPQGTLLWDTGLGDALVGHPMDMPTHKAHFYETVSLVSQLKSLGYAPADITYLAISHAHMDHTGNAALFLKSTWLVQRKELAFAAAASTTSAISTQLAVWAEQARAKPLDGDHDVFGDGSVMILSTPGHTPGHQSLLLHLAHTGTVILSGDLYHLRANFENRRVPVYNISRADTLASEDRVEKILKRTSGRLIIQHDPKDFEALPKPPHYLD